MLEAKATVIVQLTPIFKVVPQVLPVIMKSLLFVPLTETVPTDTFALPVFVRVAASDSLCATTVL